MKADEDRKWWDQRWLLGVPRWGWAIGLTIGMAVGMTMFNDNLIVGAMFGVSIGMAFAMAFAERKPSDKKAAQQQRDQ